MTRKRSSVAPKAHAIRRHAIERFRERIGEDMGQKDLTIIRQMIQKGNTRILDKVSNTRTVHEVCYANRTFRVVYDKSRHLVVTVLT